MATFPKWMQAATLAICQVIAPNNATILTLSAAWLALVLLSSMMDNRVKYFDDEDILKPGVNAVEYRIKSSTDRHWVHYPRNIRNGKVETPALPLGQIWRIEIRGMKDGLPATPWKELAPETFMQDDD